MLPGQIDEHEDEQSQSQQCSFSKEGEGVKRNIQRVSPHAAAPQSDDKQAHADLIPDLKTENESDTKTSAFSAPLQVTPQSFPNKRSTNATTKSHLSKLGKSMVNVMNGRAEKMDFKKKEAMFEKQTQNMLLERLDVDGDGQIDYTEFSTLVRQILEDHQFVNTLQPLERKFALLIRKKLKSETNVDVGIRKLFDSFDDNASGKISKKELYDGLRQMDVLNTNFMVHGRKLRLADTSLYLFGIKSSFRKKLVWLVEWKWFDRFILACIVLNSIILALQDYQDPGNIKDLQGRYNRNWRNQLVEDSEIVFTTLFTIECVFKVIAMGFVLDPGSYLRDYWNCLDFLVVLAGFISILPGVPTLSSLRSFRVMRPLRTLSSLPGLRILITSLLASMPVLINVLLILLFVFAIFGIVGVIFWHGVLHYQCRLTPQPVNGTWMAVTNSRACGGGYACKEGETCGSYYDLPLSNKNAIVDYTTETYSASFNYGITNFDNIGNAMLTIFQCVTTEGWTNIMYQIQDASNPTLAALYFISLIIVGSFFLLNVVFAVIWSKFDDPTNPAAASSACDPTIAHVKPVENKDEHYERAKRAEMHGSEATSTRSSKDCSTSEAMNPKLVSKVSSSSHENLVSIVAVKGLPFRWTSSIRSLVQSGLFSYFILLCIVLNTVFLAMDEYPEQPSQVIFLEKANIVLTVVFASEMLLKLVGLGWREYRQDLFNVFDGIIVCISLFEVAATLMDPSNFNGSGLSALRTFRLFRIFKLARSWTSLRDLLLTIVQSLPDVANFGLLLVLVMYIFALLGMQFFANTFRFDVHGQVVTWEPHRFTSTNPGHAPWTHEKPYESSRSNFDDIFAALTTVFQIMTVEDWNRVMYDGVRVQGRMAAIYFVLVVFVGNFIVLNLFLAILLGHFDTVAEDAKATTVATWMKQSKKVWTSVSNHSIRALSPLSPLSPSPSPHFEKNKTKPENQGINKNKVKSIDNDKDIDKDKEKGIKIDKGNEKKAFEPGAAAAVATVAADYALGLFSSEHFLRKSIACIVKSTWFDNAIMFLIFLSSLTLALDNPLNDPEAVASHVLSICDLIITLLFLVEMFLKILCHGFIFNGNKSYLRDGWNILDFFIMVISMMSLFSKGSSTLRSIRSLRALRALRPLRLISRAPGLKVVVNALLSSIPSVMNVSFVVLLFFLIFGILGTRQFKGTFFYCDMHAMSEATQREIEATFGLTRLSFQQYFRKENCTHYGGSWTNRSSNFDNIFKSMMALFELSTTEGWVDMMHHGVDATAIDVHPILEYNRFRSVFFIVFIIVGSFFAMNLFVGAVIDNFNRMCDESGGRSLFITESQKEWLNAQEIIIKAQLKPRIRMQTSTLFRISYAITQHPNFETAIALLILVNTVFMGLQHFQEDSWITTIREGANFVFWFIFLSEAIMKLIVQRKQYFTNGWNIFDFAVAAASTIANVISIATDLDFPGIGNVARTFRLGLAIRLMKNSKTMEGLFNSIMFNLPALLNVSALMFLMIFVYSVMGVQLFAEVKLQEFLNEHANFQTLGRASVTLFRFTTGEAWNAVMYDLLLAPIDGALPIPYGPSCVKDPTYEQTMHARTILGDPTLTIGCTPNEVFTYMFFVSFNLITTFVLLNLFVAVILEGFESPSTKESLLSEEHFRILVHHWLEFDPDATCVITHHHLVRLLALLPPPLGIGDSPTRSQLFIYASSLHIRVDPNNRVHFVDVASALSRRVIETMAARRGEDVLFLSEPSLHCQLYKDHVSKAKAALGGEATLDLRDVLAATKIASLFRQKLAKKAVNRKRAQNMDRR